MLANQLSTVTSEQNVKELRSYVNPPIDALYRVRRPAVEPFREVVAGIVLQIVEDIKPYIEAVTPHCDKLVGLDTQPLQSLLPLNLDWS